MAIDAEIAKLESLRSSELRERWVALVGSPAPRVGANMLRLALAWEMQARVLGGLPRSTAAALDQLARGSTITHAAVPGMRLVREWSGKAHVVVVGEDQVIRWDGRE